MRRWWVQLSGREGDLKRLVQLFSSEECRVWKEGEDYYLVSERFERCATSSEVHTIAEECLPYMESVAAFLDHPAEAELDGIVEHGEDGQRKRHVFARASAAAMVIVCAHPASVEGNAETVREEPAESVRLLRLAMEEDRKSVV